MLARYVATLALVGGVAWATLNAAACAESAENDNRLTRAVVRALLEREAAKVGLPADIAEAVVQVESSFNPMTVGLVGEIGLMQVRPQTAAMLGFRGTPDDLARPEINIHYGVTYLAKAWRLADGDLCRALMKYRAGHGEEQMSQLSVTYCERARRHLATLNSSFAIAGVRGEVMPLSDQPARKPADVSDRAVKSSPAATSPITAPRQVYARFKQGSPSASRAYWAAHEMRIRAIKMRLASRWRVASR